jgi:hypothetical protein
MSSTDSINAAALTQQHFIKGIVPFFKRMQGCCPPNKKSSGSG